MKDINTNEQGVEEAKKPEFQHGKKVIGIVIILLGAFLLLKRMGIEFPNWVLSPAMFLLVTGLLLGFFSKFKNYSWLVLTIIGSLLLIGKLDIGFNVSHFIFPVIIIVIGVFILLGHKKNLNLFSDWNWDSKSKLGNSNGEQFVSDNGYLEVINIFGGTKKNVFTKNFRGGDVVAVFGGATLNFQMSEINGVAVMEVVNIFGGAKIIVPANWQIKMEMVNILGGVEDKRLQQTTNDNQHVLIIKGVCIFGGVEIKSY